MNRDTRTIDLFDGWTPPAVAVRFEGQRPAQVPLAQRVSRLVAQTLRECGLERAEVARRMSAILGVEVSEHILDRYASEAADTHNIPLYRAFALAEATGDMRLIGTGLAPLGYVVIAKRYEAAIRVAMRQDAIRKLERDNRKDTALWKAGP